MKKLVIVADGYMDFNFPHLFVVFRMGADAVSVLQLASSASISRT